MVEIEIPIQDILTNLEGKLLANYVSGDSQARDAYEIRFIQAFECAAEIGQQIVPMPKGLELDKQETIERVVEDGVRHVRQILDNPKSLLGISIAEAQNDQNINNIVYAIYLAQIKDMPQNMQEAFKNENAGYRFLKKRDELGDYIGDKVHKRFEHNVMRSIIFLVQPDIRRDLQESLEFCTSNKSIGDSIIAVYGSVEEYVRIEQEGLSVINYDALQEIAEKINDRFDIESIKLKVRAEVLKKNRGVEDIFTQGFLAYKAKVLFK